MRIITTEQLRELYEPVKQSSHRLSLVLPFHDFRKVDFSALKMDFDGANLRGSDFGGVRFPDDGHITSFLAADLQSADFNEAYIVGFDFDYTNLLNVHFKNAHIVDTRFTNCNTASAHFDGAVCENCTFEGSTNPDGFHIYQFKKFYGNLSDACFSHPLSKRAWWDTKAHEIYVKFVENEQYELANLVYQEWLDSDGEV